jgi:hypothetical protein
MPSTDNLRVWDVARGVEMPFLNPIRGEVIAVEYSPDGRFLMFRALYWDLIIADAASGTPLVAIYEGYFLDFARFCDDSTLLASRDGVLERWIPHDEPELHFVRTAGGCPEEQ